MKRARAARGMWAKILCSRSKASSALAMTSYTRRRIRIASDETARDTLVPGSAVVEFGQYKQTIAFYQKPRSLQTFEQRTFSGAVAPVAFRRGCKRSKPLNQGLGAVEFSVNLRQHVQAGSQLVFLFNQQLLQA